MRDVLIKLCQKSQRDSLTVSSALMSYLLEEWKDVNVNRKTLRRNGYCNQGKWDMKYSSANYKSTGDPNKRGLVVKTEEFLQEVDS